LWAANEGDEEGREKSHPKKEEKENDMRGRK